MKRVLLVSAVFPPQLGGTSEKMARRAKYFWRYGWQTVVLAPKIPPDVRVDDTMLEQAQGVEVHRTNYIFRSRWPSLRHDNNRPQTPHQPGQASLFDLLFIPKGYLRWLPYALIKGLQVASNIDVILTMNNPVILHIIGYLLHKLSGKPWAAELRDPIVEYSYGIRGPETLNFLIERLVVKNADTVIQRLDGSPDPVSQRYPKHESKFHLIPYAGFDPEDFANPPDDISDHEPPCGLTIAYTGSFYGDTITPVPFLRSMKRVLDQNIDTSQQLRAIFAGDWDTSYEQLIDDLHLRKYAHYKGYLTHQECIRLWQRSQVLLLILGKEDENLMRVPSKFWDYLGARKPILALVHPQGETARLIREQNLGYVADPENEAEIAQALQQIMETYQTGQLVVNPDEQFYSRATRSYSEKSVVEILEKISHAT